MNSIKEISPVHEMMLDHISFKYKAQFFSVAGIFIGLVGLFFIYFYQNDLLAKIFVIAMLLFIIPTVILNTKAMMLMKKIRKTRGLEEI